LFSGEGMTDSQLYLDGIRHVYQSQTVLQVDEFRLQKGTITGLAGPNGTGKTTFLNILGLVMKPSSGTVVFDGHPVGPFSKKARHSITLLPQEPYLLKRSVFNNVAHGLMLRHDTENLDQRVHDALEAVRLSPERFAQRPSHHLSGGEARRVALAARLILKPDVLLLDEPTSNVDEQSCRMIHNAIQMARDCWGTTLVVSSHDRDWLHTTCDRVLSFFNGQIFQDGRVNIIYGPFEPMGDGMLCRSLSHGRHFSLVVPNPPHDQATAILPAYCLNLCRNKDAAPPGALIHSCLVTGKHLDGNSGRILVSLNHADHLLFSSLPVQDSRDVHPGEEIFAYYFSGDIQFR
jgi:tungstate transport system ATP-binding protein